MEARLLAFLQPAAWRLRCDPPTAARARLSMANQPPDQPEELQNMSNLSRNNKKAPLDESDLLPFDVRVVSPPPRMLGRAKLDPRTHRGDVLSYNGRDYMVRRVRMHFSLVNGRFRMTRKTAEVKTVGRRMAEKFLNELYDAS